MAFPHVLFSRLAAFSVVFMAENKHPNATAFMTGLEAVVTSEGQTDRCAAASREELEVEVMTVLFAAAHRAGGTIWVQIVESDTGHQDAFVLSSAGEISPVPGTPIVADTSVAAPEPAPESKATLTGSPATEAPSSTSTATTSALSSSPRRENSRWVAKVPVRVALVGVVALAALGAGVVAMTAQGSDSPRPAGATAGSSTSPASTTSAPTSAVPSTTAPALLPAPTVKVLSPAPGRVAVAVSGLRPGERVTVDVAPSKGNTRTAQLVATRASNSTSSSSLTVAVVRWRGEGLAAGVARWRVAAAGHVQVTGRVRIRATPPPPAYTPPPAAATQPADPAPYDPPPATSKPPRKGGGGGGGGGGGTSPVDPSTVQTAPVG